MLRPLLMPKLGLTMTEGALVEWSVQPGAAFAAEATLFVVETEKTATEIPAEAPGTLVDIVVEPGRTVPVGAIVGHWDDGLAGGATDAAPVTTATREAVATASMPIAVAPVAASAVATSPSTTAAQSTPFPADAASQRVVATPLARRRAAALGVALAHVEGSGPRGRVRAADVERAATAAPAASAGAGTASRRSPTSTEATIARRMAAAKRDIPHFYLAVEAEVSRVTALRAELNALGAGDAATAAPRITLNHFIVAAVARALAQSPEVCRVWTDEGIVTFASIDVGIAVATPKGLVAPVLRDLGRDTVGAVARKADAAIARAQAGRLARDEVEGGIITVSNAGMHDVTWMTSIINPGQAMILGVGAVRELFRPDAQGQPALRREIGMVLSCDHRVLDGTTALAFLRRVVAALEAPLGLVL